MSSSEAIHFISSSRADYRRLIGSKEPVYLNLRSLPQEDKHKFLYRALLNALLEKHQGVRDIQNSELERIEQTPLPVCLKITEVMANGCDLMCDIEPNVYVTISYSYSNQRKSWGSMGYGPDSNVRRVRLLEIVPGDIVGIVVVTFTVDASSFDYQGKALMNIQDVIVYQMHALGYETPKETMLMELGQEMQQLSKIKEQADRQNKYQAFMEGIEGLNEKGDCPRALILAVFNAREKTDRVSMALNPEEDKIQIEIDFSLRVDATVLSSIHSSGGGASLLQSISSGDAKKSIVISCLPEYIYQQFTPIKMAVCDIARFPLLVDDASISPALQNIKFLKKTRTQPSHQQEIKVRARIAPPIRLNAYMWGKDPFYSTMSLLGREIQNKARISLKSIPVYPIVVCVPQEEGDASSFYTPTYSKSLSGSVVKGERLLVGDATYAAFVPFSSGAEQSVIVYKIFMIQEGSERVAGSLIEAKLDELCQSLETLQEAEEPQYLMSSFMASIECYLKKISSSAITDNASGIIEDAILRIFGVEGVTIKSSSLREVGSQSEYSTVTLQILCNQTAHDKLTKHYADGERKTGNKEYVSSLGFEWRMSTMESGQDVSTISMCFSTDSICQNYNAIIDSIYHILSAPGKINDYISKNGGGSKHKYGRFFAQCSFDRIDAISVYAPGVVPSPFQRSR